MKLVKLFIYTSFIVVAAASADSAPKSFQFGVGNANLAPTVNVHCDNEDIGPIAVPTNTSAYTHVKYFHSEPDHQTICQFSSNQQQLGSITLELVLDASGNNVTGAYISQNKLNRKYTQIIQTEQEIYIYFKE